MKLLVRLFINALSVYLTAYLLSGVALDGYMDALIVAVVLGVVNTFIKPILIIFTLPINLITLGLFTWIINAFTVIITDRLVEGFSVESFLWALLFSLVLSAISWVLNRLAD